MTTPPVCLNLACGKKPREGWINVDFEPHPGVQLVHDLRCPLPYRDGTVAEIYAKHIVEHFTTDEWPDVLADWVRVLAPGGRLVIEAPDMLKACEAFIANRYRMRWGIWHMVIYGENGPGMAHRQGFTLGRLRDELETHGLTITRALNWHDDINQAERYNLRVEAVKP